MTVAVRPNGEPEPGAVRAEHPQAPEEITSAIRAAADALLRGEQVDLVIGYRQGWREGVPTPCFVRSAADAQVLIYDAHCTHNLARHLVGCDGYLTSRLRPQGQERRVGLVATPATMRALVGLIQEHQIRREEVVVLGISDGSAVGLEPDVVVGSVEPDREAEAELSARIEALEALNPAERWQVWEKEFANCIRCYACRQVCPFCYCEQCIADENQPQWVLRSPSCANNRMWNAIRAFHLAGRCVDCGECERACPMDIPLRVLNRALIQEVRDAYGYVAGASPDFSSPLLTFGRDGADADPR